MRNGEAMQYSEEELMRKCVCVDCDYPLNKNRICFPWGSSKPKVCAPCIETRFRLILAELDIDFDRIEEEVNGSV